MNIFKKRLKNYISPIDQFLAGFDKTHKPSLSQQAEINKYQRISQLRDHATKEETLKPKDTKNLWEDF